MWCVVVVVKLHGTKIKCRKVLCLLLKHFNSVYGGVYVIANEFVIGEYNGR